MARARLEQRNSLSTTSEIGASAKFDSRLGDAPALRISARRLRDLLRTRVYRDRIGVAASVLGGWYVPVTRGPKA